MIVVYIAGPFRAETAWKVQQNIRRAEEAGLQVAKSGMMPLIPHKNTEFFEGEMPDEFWLEGTKELLRRCDAVLILRPHRLSEGVEAELEEAKRLEKPYFFHIDDLVGWDLKRREKETEIYI